LPPISARETRDDSQDLVVKKNVLKKRFPGVDSNRCVSSIFISNFEFLPEKGPTHYELLESYSTANYVTNKSFS